MRSDHRVGGIALISGYGLLIGVLFRDPSAGVTAASGSVRGIIFLGLFPVLGLLGGLYVLRDLPYRTAVAFPAGSYLAVMGLSLLLVSGAPVFATTVVGISLFVLAVVALVTTLRSSLHAFLPGLSAGTGE